MDRGHDQRRYSLRGLRLDHAFKYFFCEAEEFNAARNHVGDLAALADKDSLQDHAAQESLFEQMVAFDCYKSAA